jgi:tetratricopeptide (TPR) repeat protein
MSIRRTAAIGAAAFAWLAASPAMEAASAQDVREHIEAGDREAAAFRPDEALKHYQAAIAVDSTSYEALWKASKAAVDLGEGERDKGKARELFRAGEGYARRAVKANPTDAEAHFHVARAVGLNALSVGVRDRVKYAVEIREQALEALRLDPQHPGALHVMGQWNAEVMRLNGFERFFAKNVLGGKVFGSASWKDAISYLERAVEIDPQRAVHKVDLGQIYLDTGDKAKARAQFEAALQAPRMDYNDPKYQEKARAALAKIG